MDHELFRFQLDGGTAGVCACDKWASESTGHDWSAKKAVERAYEKHVEEATK